VGERILKLPVNYQRTRCLQIVTHVMRAANMALGGAINRVARGGTGHRTKKSWSYKGRPRRPRWE
jgi:hypothetical protein